MQSIQKSENGLLTINLEQTIEEANASVPVVVQSVTASANRLPPLPRKYRANEDSPMGFVCHERSNENLRDGSGDNNFGAEEEDRKADCRPRMDSPDCSSPP